MVFPQLYTKTAYSLLNSTIKISQYVETALERGYHQLALTDQNVLYGAVEFYEACKKSDIKPIIGLDYHSSTQHLLLYAANLTGYHNLMKISSKRLIEEDFSLEQHPEWCTGLFAVLPTETLLREKEMLIATLERLDLLPFEELLYECGFPEIELPFESQELLKKASLEPIALHQVAYLDGDEAFAVEVMRHIQEGTRIEKNLNHDQLNTTGSAFLLEELQLREWFENAEPTALANAQRIADACHVEIPLHQSLYPHYPLPEGSTAEKFLADLCWEAFPKRIKSITPVYEERLRMELEVIHQMGFDDYFLIVWDVMDFTHKTGIVTGAGRGSGAASLVAYVLSITDVDPIQYGLLFERFLNVERHNMPDFDLDIPDNRRNEVLHYVKEKYGTYHVAQIATFGTMAAKMVLRDVGRVFGLSQSESNRWSAAVPKQLKISLKEAYEKSARFAELVNSDQKSRLLFETASILEGLPRHVSTHAAGVVISDENLLETIPLQAGSEDILLTQFTMHDVEALGLLKMDFLGLRNLSIIDHALKDIRRIYKQDLKIKEVPLDDEKTLAIFQRGETAGVFQFESAGIRNVLRKLGPNSIEDIAAVNALYRPGPMENIDHFIRRKKGQEPIEYPDDSLIDILENTYGVIVYQEQVMQVAAKMAGYSLGQADILRRAMSKKKKSVLDAERKNFVSGAMARGYSSEKADQVYDYIERFANYGFNRAHAFAYSFVGYQMAYLKAHYPGPFYAALMDSVSQNPQKVKEYLNEARKNSIQILQPDINQSYYNFTLTKNEQIRFGLTSIKGIRRDFVKEIIEERRANGKYTSVDNFLLRQDQRWLKTDILLPMILVGAFDSLSSNRKQIAEELSGKIQNVIYSGGSTSLLDILSLKEEEIADYTLEERLQFEEEHLGIYLSGHPTEGYTKLRLSHKLVTVTDLIPEKSAEVLLYIKNIREIRTKKGEKMAFLDANDYTGEISVTLFPRLYRQLGNVEQNSVYLVRGKVEVSRYDQSLQILAEQVTVPPTDDDVKICYLRVTDVLDTSENREKLMETIKAFPGHSPVVIYFTQDKRKVALDKRLWVEANESFKNEISQLLGSENCVLK